MPKIIVVHEGYGCDTGCCGHVVRVDGKRVGDFDFGHPYNRPTPDFVRELVTRTLGAEHVKDIDWDHCVVVED
jgi:hypothetical protein